MAADATEGAGSGVGRAAPSVCSGLRRPRTSGPRVGLGSGPQPPVPRAIGESALRATASDGAASSSSERPASAITSPSRGRQQRAVALVHAARADAASQIPRAWAATPATSSRPPSPPPSGGAIVDDLIHGLSRSVERGEPPSMCLLLQCLEHLRGLQLSGPGGIDLVWKVAPVLRAAKEELLQANDQRQALEAEAWQLREKAKQLDKDVEAKYGELGKAEEIAAERVRRHLATKQDFDEAAAQLLRKIAEVDAETADLHYQAGDGLVLEREAWEDDRQQLEAEIAQLDKDIESKTQLLNVDLQEQAKQHQEQIRVDKKRFKEFEPFADEQGELRRKIVFFQNKCSELERQMQEIEGKKAAKKPKPGKKGSKSTSRKPSPDGVAVLSAKNLTKAEEEASKKAAEDAEKAKEDEGETFGKQDTLGVAHLGLLEVKDLKSSIALFRDKQAGGKRKSLKRGSVKRGSSLLNATNLAKAAEAAAATESASKAASEETGADVQTDAAKSGPVRTRGYEEDLPDQATKDATTEEAKDAKTSSADDENTDDAKETFGAAFSELWSPT